MTLQAEIKVIKVIGTNLSELLPQVKLESHQTICMIWESVIVLKKGRQTPGRQTAGQIVSWMDAPHDNTSPAKAAEVKIVLV